MHNIDVSIFDRGSTKSLFEWDGLQELISFIRNNIKNEYASGDPLAPVAYILFTENPHGEVLDEPAVAVIKPTDVTSFSREAFLLQVSTLCVESKAIGVLLAFEGWLVEGSPEEIAEVNAGGLRELRKDVLVVSLEHRSLGKRLWRAMLTTKGLMTEIGPFDLADESLTQHMALLA